MTTEARVELGGRATHYRDSGGTGPALVLLHAFPFDGRMWDAAVASLTGARRLILPDLRGFGQSALGGGPYAIADLADDVAALLDHLGIPRAALGGLSMGGYVALAFAARHRARLQALILADTRAGADTPEGRAGRDQAMALVRDKGVEAYADAQLPKLVAPGTPAEIKAQVRALAAGQSRDAVLAGLAALRDRPDRSGELAAIACPTLVIVGAEDAVTPPREATAMAGAIAGARLVELPGAGHLTALEQPGPFASALAAFL